MKRLAIALALLVCATPGFTQDLKGATLFTPLYLSHNYDKDREYRDEDGGGLKIEHFFTNKCSLDLMIGGIATEVKATGEKERLFDYDLNGNYHFLSGPFRPYISLGLAGDSDDMATNAGIGAKYIFTDYLGLDAAVRRVFIGQEADVVSSIGVSFILGAEKPAPKPEPVVAAAPVAAPEPDTDKDGVIDKNDACANTPAGVTVDAKGCPVDTDKDGVADYLDKCANTPAGVKVDAAGCPLDSDKDGVLDMNDSCPYTPAGVKVDEKGCPFDSDKDGVADAADKCPNTPVGVKTDANGCPVDSDKDGVNDVEDSCPNTPAGVSVDAKGCPVDTDKDGVADYLDKCANTSLGIKVDAAGCPLDSDGDGIADYLDICPNTPKGFIIDTNGCSKDSDKDGVVDSLDKCADTPAGMAVKADGCLEKVTLKIQFDTASSAVRPQYQEEISAFATYLKVNSSVTVEIQGHTDNRGSAANNRSLSQRRADAIKDVLVKTHGIEASRITTTGYGPDMPVASNDTDEGRQQNRRIDVILK